jgi:uncharacterized protein (DUF1501 family)
MAGTSPVFILVNLAGGVSYNIAPPYNGVYYSRNPNVGYQPETSLPLIPEQGLHPSLTGFKAVYDEGKLGVVNMVGYPEGNRSHDESTQVWFRGIRNANAATTGGWAARLTCQVPGNFAGISLGGANLLIQGDCNPPRAFGDLSQFGESGFWGGDNGTTWLRITRNDTVATGSGLQNEGYVHVRNSIDRVQLSVEAIKRETNITLPVTFPNTGFGGRCRDAAKLLAARTLGVRFIYLEHGGFDTHSDEKTRLTQLLDELNGGITALVEASKALGRWNETIIVTMSEFGRTMENGSKGTDHGHATPMFLLGGRVNGGLKSAPPDAAESGRGHFFDRYFVDFRTVFKEVVREMGIDPNSVFTEQPAPADLRLFV